MMRMVYVKFPEQIFRNGRKGQFITPYVNAMLLLQSTKYNRSDKYEKRSKKWYIVRFLLYIFGIP